MNDMAVPRPNNLDAFWMPYTDNRYFKAHPRMLARAEGMSYFTPEGREVLDATAGLWCCNAGHGRREITEAIQKQAAVLDFAPTFQLGHPLAFEAAARLAEIGLPVAVISRASFSPATRGRRCVPPAPGSRPSFTSGTPSFADGTATR